MNLATPYATLSLDEVKARLAGGTLTVHSVARPPSADQAVDRSGVLAVFTFADPAFDSAVDGLEQPLFLANPVPAQDGGVPGFVRARAADGTVVADFSAGPGAREIKFAEVSCSEGAPVRLTAFLVMAEGGWPEQPDYYHGKPRPGFPLPATP
ncbi:hypothetical protein UAJ10_19650 [Nitrospirillum sp. BR 11164]|uniref:hypothetical protein n=1 Tax=Nitrospirillum sp. BR 11164 TaxID=3104324 RepID=UPI002AFF21B5|nr:hypothetical protein [Nitrospirillum sp. BR 11164]MEA1651229.1 hypothetical protein [Nitrospirillum sp. BR 11164]